MDINAILIPIGTGIVRSVAGWLENAMEDGQIDTYEWGQLGATVVRVALIGLGLHYGLNMDAIAASASALVADFVIGKLKR